MHKAGATIAVVVIMGSGGAGVVIDAVGPIFNHHQSAAQAGDEEQIHSLDGAAEKDVESRRKAAEEGAKATKHQETAAAADDGDAAGAPDGDAAASDADAVDEGIVDFFEKH